MKYKVVHHSTYNEITNPVRWCHSKFGPDDSPVNIWDRTVYTTDPAHGFRCTATYYFQNEEDAVLFMLTWGWCATNI